MTVRQMRNRLDRLAPTSAGRCSYDPDLADKWGDVAANRYFQLRDKPDLTAAEQSEMAELAAAELEWRRKHWPNDFNADGTPIVRIGCDGKPWTKNDQARICELAIRNFHETLTSDERAIKNFHEPLTSDERAELAALKARQPPPIVARRKMA